MKRKMVTELGTATKEVKPSGIPIGDSAETNDQFVSRLLAQGEFPARSIHEELCEYARMRQAGDRPFIKYHFLERLLAAKRAAEAEVNTAQRIAAALFDPGH
jgi:hypothetical protein